MEYIEAWQFLDDLQFFKIKLGLDSMRSFLASLEQPQEKLQFVHIAGTNGKGSTAANLFSILSEAGFTVGMYSSPHLSSVRERFKINGSYISEKDFAHHAEKIINILEGRQITYFEFATTLAFLWFAAENVDIVLLEVGMGGRLDATNVVTPLVSVITNVSMDHEAYLGNTLSAVATEKAGIIKDGIPVVCGASKDDSLVVIEKTAQEHNAPLYLLGRDFSVHKESKNIWTYKGISVDNQHDQLVSGLLGSYQIENSALALATLELMQPFGFDVSANAIRVGLKKTRWPGRLEYFILNRTTRKILQEGAVAEKIEADNHPEAIRFLLDGAHNPAGIDGLKKALEESFSYGSLICIWASMGDKDISNSLLPVAPLFDRIILTRPEYERSAKPEDIKKLLPEKMQASALCTDSVETALEAAIKIVEPDDLILIAGSLYLIGKARQILLGEVA